MVKKVTRRKFMLYGAGAFFASLAYFFTHSGYRIMGMNRKERSFLKNNDLTTIKQGYPGNEIVNGKFAGGMDHSPKMFGRVLKWRLSKNPQEEEKRDDPYRLQVRNDADFFDVQDDALIWFGNASFLIRLDGVNFLLDPCFGKPPFVKRLADAPCSVDDIRNIDYLLISHSHYDHLDGTTLQGMPANGTTALLPLRLGDVVSFYNQDLKIQEAAWFQQYNMPAGVPEVYLLPAKHWSSRSLTDANRTLWGSYLIKGKNTTLYFAGDTAYDGHFKEIAQLFPGIDICLMPVGAYKPPYIMKKNHTSPTEAVNAFHDLGGKVFIPMHYGTFDLSDEPPGEPVRVIKNMQSRGLIKGETRFLDVGEIYYL